MYVFQKYVRPIDKDRMSFYGALEILGEPKEKHSKTNFKLTHPIHFFFLIFLTNPTHPLFVAACSSDCY